VPDGGGVGVFGDLGRVGAPVGELRRDIALFGDVDAPEMADALLVLGVLAQADVQAVIMDNRRGDEIVTRAAGT